MTNTPFANVESLRIGVVDFISPDEVKILLDIDAPESVALNAGSLRPFPRINGYVLVPADDGYLVGQIEWMTIERSPFPKRRGVQDFGVVDLPYPMRKVSLNPLGMLRKRNGQDERYVFHRGADSLPSLGSPVLLPTDDQLRSIVESGECRHVLIGTSPLAANAKVCVDPDRLFGRHLAVLGNTGSGKSCSVAGLIRWSLEMAQRQDGTPSNARFIVLDPNGEYSRAFVGTDDVLNSTVFRVDPGEGELPLRVPLWFWNSTEWCAFSQASAKTQRPLLKRALREIKAGRVGVELTEDESKLRMRRYLSSNMITLQRDILTQVIKTDATKFGFRLRAIHNDIAEWDTAFPGHKFQEICGALDAATSVTYKTFISREDGKTVEYYTAFTDAQVHRIIECMSSSLETLGGIVYQEGPDENVPLQFRGVDLADHLQILAEQEGVGQYLDFLISRIRMFLADPNIRSVIGEGEDLTLVQWLTDYVGGTNDGGNHLAIIDLSLVPTDIIHVVTAVIARMVFESLQRYRKLKGVALPTVLVMEEAHTFVKRYKDDTENQDAATICCQVFERIAREGRKFGLGLVLSSQRPSELSQTVLSQCNTFLLHRISNDRDQEQVQKLVPDNLRGLLRELPSLPSQHAILLGWASELPILVKMRDLPKTQQPHSDDPDFWHVWTGKDDEGNEVRREADWAPVVNDWQGTVVPHALEPEAPVETGVE